MAETQVYLKYPQLGVLYTQFEKDVTGLDVWPGILEKHWWVPLYCVAVYIIFIVVGPIVMAKRKRFELRLPLQLWNLLLCTFSFCGAVRTVPHLLSLIHDEGLYYSICHDPVHSYGAKASGVWTILFILSKIPELFDTFFIVMRKSNLIFLHWYHHITVLLFCWHSLVTKSSAGLYFISMNYSVHAVMYFYYFLSSCRIRVSWGKFVTVFQISQMAVGIAVNCLIFKYWSENKECLVAKENFVAGLVMYASYFVLFGLFYLHRYCTAEKDAKKTQ
eukprot:CAMPEP_0175119574 /NCGR_PEP_ID=MMETSP0087-20121206/139_1 /TAXON_ID=136419 /ORGANISM="Unknown Unknown, Strain D1" /LENGTH=274 /DNA_ID=CAMNT_0016400921 /DNA_START=47 /DNA_END=868 /DNA_ORIENTATION=-